MIRLRRCAASARQVPAFAAGLLRRGKHIVATMVVLLTGGSATVLACPVCFNAEETSLIEGTRVGILVLLGITLVVQGGFVGFFVYLRRRSKLNADVELDMEWSELQRGSRRS